MDNVVLLCHRAQVALVIGSWVWSISEDDRHLQNPEDSWKQGGRLEVNPVAKCKTQHYVIKCMKDVSRLEDFRPYDNHILEYLNNLPPADV